MAWGHRMDAWGHRMDAKALLGYHRLDPQTYNRLKVCLRHGSNSAQTSTTAAAAISQAKYKSLLYQSRRSSKS